MSLILDFTPKNSFANRELATVPDREEDKLEQRKVANP